MTRRTIDIGPGPGCYITTTDDGASWRIYLMGSLVSWISCSQAEAINRATHLTREDYRINADDAQEKMDRMAAENGDGAGRYQFRSPR